MTTVDDRPARNTPVLNLPVPGDENPADAPADIGALADALDNHAAAGQFGWQPGALQPTAALAAPTGWLLCQGQAISRTIYAALFAAIGTTYGAGDASTTFNLPDFRDRMIVGASPSRPIGTTGGEAAHTLSTAELPSHNHTGTSGVDWPDHSHTPGNSESAFATNLGNNFIAGGSGWGFQSSTGGASARHAHSIPSDGGGAAHNNMPPFVAVNVMIKT